MPPNQEIRGNALKIYLYLLKHGASELRDIQRGIGLSTASLASYHLGKLVEGGFVKQDDYGRYLIAKDSPEKILDGYSRIGPAVVPQLFFFSLFFTILIALFSLAIFYNQSFTNYLIVVCVGMALVFWYETFRLWRKLSA
jgi:hypothetical protein